MATRVAINGFGRVGRAFFRQAFGRDDIEIVAINDLGNLENLAYLLKFDSVYGRYDHNVSSDDANEVHHLLVDDAKILVLSEPEPEKLPWGELSVDIVVEATGFFASDEGAQKHIVGGAKRVVITAPAKGDVQQLLIGTNDDRFDDPDLGAITCNASCTTNAAAPAFAILHEALHVKKGIVQTVHSYTSTQALVDMPDRKGDFRRGRAAAMNIVPASTGAAKAVGRSVPELQGRFDGMAFRVPTVAGSLAMMTSVVGRETTVKEVQDLYRQAANEPRWKGIVAASDDPLVSSDIIGRTEPAIIDLPLIRVTGGDLVTVYSWYDNEWGYAYSLVEHVSRLGAKE